MKPLNIYIHIPFCASKCPYCAFYSCVKQENLYEEYFKRLREEILQRSKQYKEREIKTIYIGGGTPNLVPCKYIVEVIGDIKKYFHISDDLEISIELYPQYISEKQALAYKNIGVNRVSLGVQTTQERYLKQLTRRYTFEDVVERVTLLKKNDFKDIGIDLIFGFPDHTLKDWKESLEKIIALDIQHISCYSLEIEKKSVYGHLNEQGKLDLPSEYTDRGMYHYACKYLQEKAFKQYEISNFAREGYECKHNLNFWNYQDYLGLGAGAYSRVDDVKFHNPEDLEGYISGKVITDEKLSDLEERSERRMLGLRLNTGIPYEEKYFKQEYMERAENQMILNTKGKDLYNIVVKEILH